MTRSILVAGLCIVALAGCGRTIVRETVVEKPVVTERVIERPAVAIATPQPASCMLERDNFASGSTSCQAGIQYRCENGAWTRIPNGYC